MSNWGTLYNEVLLRSGGGRTSDNDKVLVKVAAVDAIARHDSRHFFFNAQRFTVATVAAQATYAVADGLPAGIVRFVSPYLGVDRDQDADNRYFIPRRSIDLLDRLRSGVNTASEPECWSYFDEALELYPTPEAVHDLQGKAVVKPGVPIKRLETATWKFYKPWTTSFSAGNELTDAYPASPDTNAWFTEPLAYAVILAYTQYLMWSDAWHGVQGQEQRALQRYLEVLQELEDRSLKLEEPREVEPYPLEAVV